MDRGCRRYTGLEVKIIAPGLTDPSDAVPNRTHCAATHSRGSGARCDLRQYLRFDIRFASQSLNRSHRLCGALGTTRTYTRPSVTD
jgi:hypothetical protein